MRIDISLTSNSVVASNTRLLLHEVHSEFDDIAGMSRETIERLLSRRQPTDIAVACYGLSIRELCLVRDGVLSLEVDVAEIRTIIDDLCHESYRYR